MRTTALFTCVLLVLLLTACAVCGTQAGQYPLSINDNLGREVTLTAPPQRVVCLFGSVTDLLVAPGRTEMLVGLSRQDFLNHSVLPVPSMGSFFQADLAVLTTAKPDLIVASVLQQNLLQPWLDDPQQQCKVLFFREGSLEQDFARMALIGALVERAIEGNKSATTSQGAKP